MKKTITVLVLALATLFLLTSVVWVQPDEEPVPTIRPVDAGVTKITVDPETEASFHREGIAGTARPEPLTAQEWIDQTLAEAGLTPTVPVQVRGTGICNGQEAWGCTSHMLDRKTKARKYTVEIWISSEVVGTPLGKYVLLHEVGHDYGDMSECGADAFAIAHGASTEFQRC